MSNNKRKKFLVGYADCMYCDADDVKLFIILPGLDREDLNRFHKSPAVRNDWFRARDILQV